MPEPTPERPKERSSQTRPGQVRFTERPERPPMFWDAKTGRILTPNEHADIVRCRREGVKLD